MNKSQLAFVQTVKNFYKKSGRHDLPWRQTTDPYLILVSEIMLQQTQVERVIPKYELFISAYPTSKKLSRASLKDVLMLWQGLGYNRRAKALLEAARHIEEQFEGVFPCSKEAILSLPGVGSYTTGAVLAFAFNEAHVMIETNIRTVFLHHFFLGRHDVPDSELLPLIAGTLDTVDPRTWYYALMDYGSHLKKTVPNPSKRSAQYTKQSKFEGSNRQIRGALIRVLTAQAEPQTLKSIQQLLVKYGSEKLQEQLESLMVEGLVNKIKTSYQLPI